MIRQRTGFILQQKLIVHERSVHTIQIHDNVKTLIHLAMQTGKGGSIIIIIDLSPLYKCPVLNHLSEGLSVHEVIINTTDFISPGTPTGMGYGIP